MFVGKEDKFSTPLDAGWARDQLGPAVVHYHELENTDHSAFNFGRDMSYLNSVLDLIEEYNPLHPLFDHDDKTVDFTAEHVLY